MGRKRLFIGTFPTGISYADTSREVNGDYMTLARLSFATLVLEWYGDVPASLRRQIERHAAAIQSRRGEQYPISWCGQTVTLGGR